MIDETHDPALTSCSVTSSMILLSVSKLPLSRKVTPSALIENSKAALILSGLIPGDGSDHDVLRRRLLAGRYTEVRMLFYVGKDLFRWIDQCVEWAATVCRPRGQCHVDQLRVRRRLRRAWWRRRGEGMSPHAPPSCARSAAERSICPRSS